MNLLAIAALLLLSFETFAEEKANDKVTALVETDLTDFEIELFSEKAPGLVGNFVELSRKGFYDGTYVYSLIEGLAVGMGAKNKEGSSDAGYTIDDSFDKSLTFETMGMVAYSSTGPDMSSSQFIVTLVPTPHFQDKYPIFGRVKDAETVLKTIKEKYNKDQTPKIKKITITPESYKVPKFTKRTPFSNDDIEDMTVEKAKSLLENIFEQEELGKLKDIKLSYKSVRGRRVQVAFEAKSDKSHRAKIILLGALKNKEIELQQFQYQQIKAPKSKVKTK